VSRNLGYEGEIRNLNRGVFRGKFGTGSISLDSFWGMKRKFGIETVGLLGGNSESEPGQFRESQFGV
jgi:hypothetical protein